MAEFIVDDLELKFAEAVDFIPSLVSSLKSDQLLKFYAFYKQATVGKCNTPSPYWYNFQNKQKWDAWKSLGDLPQDEAMNQYILLLSEVSPDWEAEVNRKRKERSVSVSTMVPPDSELHENEKDIFDWVREDNIEKVKSLVNLNNANNLDDNGMSLLHWAADRGLTDMVACLLDLGSNINQKDSVGQTALHYACCCGHLETTKLLLSRGAKTDIACVEGLTPLNLANDQIKELLTANLP